jgi:hypothetical protein
MLSSLRVHQFRDCLDDSFERRQPQSPLICQANRSSGDLDVLESLLPPFRAQIIGNLVQDSGELLLAKLCLEKCLEVVLNRPGFIGGSVP